MARIPESAVRNTAAASARIARQIEAFLKSGNKINEIERGKSAFYTPDGKDSETQRAVAIAITTPSKSDHIQQKRRNKKHEANQAKRRKKILYVLSKHPSGLSRNAISEKTEIGRSVLLKLIKEMAFSGTVQLDGKYLVVSPVFCAPVEMKP